MNEKNKTKQNKNDLKKFDGKENKQKIIEITTTATTTIMTTT